MFKRILLLTLLLTMAVSCEYVVEVSSVVINTGSIELAAGESYVLIANVSPSNATNTDITWLSSNTSVAAVSGNGTVTAKYPGTATVTATTYYGGYTASCRVNVSSSTSPTAPISISIDGYFNDWAALPSGSFSEAFCDENTVHKALTYCKVFADADYIYVYFEWDTDKISYKPNEEHVPFHCYINSDGNAHTGGFMEMFSDACADILLEGWLYGDLGIISYDPCVCAWTGEVNGSGWYWEWLANFDYYSGVGNGSGIRGRYEFQIDRSKIWSAGYPIADVFSIGFDIQQNWSCVGVLPNAAVSNDNPKGIAPSLRVITIK